MIFKRRDSKSAIRAVAEFLWPRGGWLRAFHYVRHRLRRLPDSPERIARGIWAGVFASFTPFFGLHFVLAALLARISKGNVIASLMGTFFGNPLTYVPIAVTSLETGHWLLGTQMHQDTHRSFGGKFADAVTDLGHNLLAIFNGTSTDWGGLLVFYHEIFFPYLVGSIFPGFLVGGICYYIFVPIIRVYQKRRKGAIKAKFDSLKAKAAAKAEALRKSEEGNSKNS